LVHKKYIFVLLILGAAVVTSVTFIPSTVVSYSTHSFRAPIEVSTASPVERSNENKFVALVEKPETRTIKRTPSKLYYDVPFYSQFADISATQWQKVGCGIASVAMMIDFYSEEQVSVDGLLQQGIDANAFLPDAGWTHQGLINLTKQFGLDGQTVGLHHLTTDSAFLELQSILIEGPVMVSVHYTFDPSNPIPHLAVITGADDERVYYNDPADLAGEKSISATQFKSAWKKRYIEIRPVV
jgi:predicted double-glycine peptidase